jgi:Methyltransferase domain
MSGVSAGLDHPVSQQSEHGSFLDAYPDGIEHHYWSIARNRMIQNLVTQHTDAASPILEIGCARGVVTQSLRNNGIDCWGVDLEDSPAMNDSIGQYLQTGIDFFDLDPKWIGQFKTILMLDVLEHIEEPAVFLRAVLDRAPSVERVIVTMPARMELWSNYDEHYGHYLRYDRDSMHTMADSADVRIRDCGYAFRALLAAGWFTGMLGMKRSTTIQPPSSMMRPLHGFIAAVMGMEYALLPEGIAGSSIYAVLERQEKAEG